MKSCCHTSFYLNYPIEEVFNRLADLGYGGVEISALSECGTFTPELLNEKRIEEITTKAKNVGLEIVSYDCELLPSHGRNLASFHSKVRDYTSEYIISAISTAKKLDAKFLVVSAGMAMYGNTKQEAWIWLIPKLKECTRWAENQGIILLLEHTTMLEGNMVVTLEDLRLLLQEISSKNFLPLIDTGHVVVNGESIVDYIKRFKDQIMHIHIDDNNGKADDHLPPGLGTINFDPLFHILYKMKYTGYLSIEPSFAFSHDPDSAAFIGLKFLKNKLSQLENT